MARADRLANAVEQSWGERSYGTAREDRPVRILSTSAERQRGDRSFSTAGRRYDRQKMRTVKPTTAKAKSYEDHVSSKRLMVVADYDNDVPE